MVDQELTWTGVLARWDRRLFDAVARRHWPGADRVLPRLGRAANHGVLWGGAAAAIAVFGSAGARKAALRGAASLALASSTINTVGKWSVRRPRPLLEGVPVVRQLAVQPQTTSFPSGHSASAFAFAAGVALASPAWGAVLAPVAASVAFSRVYTGVHYPSDVAAGAALGVGAAFVVRRLARDVQEARAVPGDERKAIGVPALPEGAGLTVVVNTGSGTAAAVPDLLRTRLPKAEVIECEGAELLPALARAASHATVLGVCGGDGTINAAATAALRADVPLAVFPGGTLNHFALDLGLIGPEGTCEALEHGEAVRIGVGRFSPGPDGEPGYFLNNFSIGAYPELLRHRLRWGPRIGGGPAALLAAWKVLRAERPVRLSLAGRPRSVWLLFAGNGTYHGTGPAPGRRDGLGEGLLDLRLVHGGGRPGPRLLAAAFAGPLSRSPVHAATRLRSLRIGSVPAGTPLAYDGEYAKAPSELVLDALPDALTVYRPL
ncbi:MULTISPECIES: bifunctional phosphatase PAP2/diacylglycerol kinase family protein [Streptomyces]|uniref:bifunctional phosphatase PAP2/diacylglycerol kinase family protein n=1 Tax=Streptomyces TaxID=1883 RepID=UPI0004BD9268|nr:MULTISPECIES: bifunctional phosphatase PAP2/diacylglycerol kinase family protein [Streptomyces]KJY20360.1 phosphoesterase [Streptomyces sp. NRRL S-104]KOU32548.1 phosphoesterase [Streptomyces sp. WM6373]KOU68742.1 phosphoesterase [Streptomyces sp. IGB124]KOU73869.1 phosphoesterase [Streptomyces sp. XY66]KOU84721.1 phosphoesterase [Streptomyces sp. XY58]